jgi:hypothetical protein
MIFRGVAYPIWGGSLFRGCWGSGGIASAVVDHKRLGSLGILHPVRPAGRALVGLTRSTWVRRAEMFRVFRPWGSMHFLEAILLLLWSWCRGAHPTRAFALGWSPAVGRPRATAPRTGRFAEWARRTDALVPLPRLIRSCCPSSSARVDWALRGRLGGAAGWRAFRG